MGREHDFGAEEKKEAWTRQHDNCACCGKNLERQARVQEELPKAHHAVPNQSGDLSREQDPWMSSQNNCVYLCHDCHDSVAHTDGQYRDGPVAGPDKFKYSHGDYKNDPEARRKHEEWSKEVNERWDQKHERYKASQTNHESPSVDQHVEHPAAPKKLR